MNPFQQVDTIHFLDIGCSGGLQDKWAPLAPLLSHVGFDSNEQECEKLKKRPTPFGEARYLPCTLAGRASPHTLYKTESIYCFLLLEPNQNWLERFTIAPLVRETGTETVKRTTLNDLVKRENLQADIIKLDAQGMDLPILRAGDKLLAGAFCVKTESSFAELYRGEPTYGQAEEFTHAHGFMLFDSAAENRVSRANPLRDCGHTNSYGARPCGCTTSSPGNEFPRASRPANAC